MTKYIFQRQPLNIYFKYSENKLKMKIHNHSVSLLFTFVIWLFGLYTMNSQVDSVFVSDVNYKNAKFNNSHSGSGFLLKYNDKVFGITAKHVLFFAKTNNMQTVSFGDELEAWTFRSAHDIKHSIKLGRLVNENPEELIEMPPQGDWLIFEMNTTLPEYSAVYKLREKPLQKGEKVSFLGFPYNTTKPIKVEGKFVGLTKEGNLSLDVPNGDYAGCSGGPVIDNEGKLVGIVSMGYFDKKRNKHIFEPASLDYFYSVMKNRL